MIPSRSRPRNTSQTAMHLGSLLLGVAVTLVSQILASPVGFGDSGDRQIVFSESGRGYENGELPPIEGTPGWIDPRLNGGRFLDVRMLY